MKYPPKPRPNQTEFVEEIVSGQTQFAHTPQSFYNSIPPNTPQHAMRDTPPLSNVIVFQKEPCQQSKRSSTFLGITHWTPKRKRTISHSSLESNKWSTISPSFLHRQHQLTKMMFLLRKFSTVRIFPNKATHTNRKTLKTFGFQMLFHGK